MKVNVGIVFLKRKESPHASPQLSTAVVRKEFLGIRRVLKIAFFNTHVIVVEEDSFKYPAAALPRRHSPS